MNMCIAIPGKITEIEGNKGLVSFGGTEMKVHLGMVEANVGEYVLVHAGCAIEILPEDRAMEMIKLFEELDDGLEEI
jgi:hydrogenase expression/formation protein HypC